MLYILGMGPGEISAMSFETRQHIQNADVIIAYKLYLEILQQNFPNLKAEFIGSVMTKERDRCAMALKLSAENPDKNYVLLSSGDPGIYGMAGVCYEMAENLSWTADMITNHIQVLPGITAASAAAAMVGAPLSNDFAVLSLSDALMPLEILLSRAEAVAKADLVTCFYNPRSKRRPDYLAMAREIFLKYRDPKTPLALVRNAYRSNAGYEITNLGDFQPNTADMLSVVIIGNSMSRIIAGRFVTNRGYEFKEE